jgi:hypothetical protein
MNHDSLFGDLITPGTPLRDLASVMPLAAAAVTASWRNEAVLVSLDDTWHSQPGLTVISDIPSIPELFEHVLTWCDPVGRSVPELLNMSKVVCLSSQVPFRIDPEFDWFDCDATAQRAGVQLVEWIALHPHSTVLPRTVASVASRWPVTV